MSSAFGSFNQSALGGFIQSALGARGIGGNIHYPVSWCSVVSDEPDTPHPNETVIATELKYPTASPYLVSEFFINYRPAPVPNPVGTDQYLYLGSITTDRMTWMQNSNCRGFDAELFSNDGFHTLRLHVKHGLGQVPVNTLTWNTKEDYINATSYEKTPLGRLVNPENSQNTKYKFSSDDQGFLGTMDNAPLFLRRLYYNVSDPNGCYLYGRVYMSDIGYVTSGDVVCAIKPGRN